jgi:nucleoid DNA-binding protein
VATKKKSAKASAGNITETLSSAASQLAKNGSVRVPGIGKFSIRATQSRKGVRRRVVLKIEADLQARINTNTPPEAPDARALVEALGSGETLRIAGLGSFTIEDHAATTNVHPRTRKTMVVPAHRALEFSGATLKK